MKCELAGRCSGCAWIARDYRAQVESKIESLRQVLGSAGVTIPEGPVECLGAGEWRLRDRADLTLEGGRLGLYGIEEAGIIDMAACPMMSPRLESWMGEFRRNLPNEIKKGSVRLRIGPSGERGVWLDLANADVKTLLDDGRWLGRLLESGAFVEIGQRRKRLVRGEGRLKLSDPEPRIWFETYDPAPVPLRCFVGSFTQAGFAANQVLVTAVMNIAGAIGANSWLELGSGIGNFTLPLARIVTSLKAVELDELSVQALTLNSAGRANIEIIRGDYRAPKVAEKIRGIEAVLCDPPRSGLGSFVDSLDSIGWPREMIYVSCFAESFAVDVARLTKCGYLLRSFALVDQFPQTPHVEIVARLSRVIS